MRTTHRTSTYIDVCRDAYGGYSTIGLTSDMSVTHDDRRVDLVFTPAGGPPVYATLTREQWFQLMDMGTFHFEANFSIDHRGNE